MKKIILTLCFIMIITLQLKAQSSNTDGFFRPEVFDYHSTDDISTPTLPKIGQNDNQKAPIGSGLFVLSGLGLGYITLKRKKIENR